jgi:hypothetical protein
MAIFSNLAYCREVNRTATFSVLCPRTFGIDPPGLKNKKDAPSLNGKVRQISRPCHSRYGGQPLLHFVVPQPASLPFSSKPLWSWHHAGEENNSTEHNA